MFVKRLPRFEYFEPSSVREALEVLRAHRGQCSLIAGGTDLLVSMKKRERVPAHLVNLKGIDELKGIHYDDNKGLRIGSLATLVEIADERVVEEACPMLKDAAEVMAAPQIRSLGTIGGNLCSASPSADTAPPLIASGASVRIIGPQGERELPVEEFFRGPGESVLEDTEILSHIFIPAPPGNSGTAYLKLMRRGAMDLAIVGVAVYLERGGETDLCKRACIALGAVAPTPMRALRAEEVLRDKKIDKALTREAGRIASEESRPIDDVRASEAYRRSMVEVLTQRAIMKALDRIGTKAS
ncbi:MAG: xanthine dehydrogenase family protein subunit M [Deltaproteobacteria bacterium]|nr:xanthine dehydrogenase family protein subunit M [Deltaproteobacteria bacterium]MBW2137847.1 xanthine dehydrogenase family protein subunit M [Deltaproteobacteria bacterium]